ncbi:hypothetical protein AMJ52_06010, partial [candidate division TA06 bacterium DG_78]
MFIVFLLVNQLDLNRASLDQMYTLPIDSTLCVKIYAYREIYGDFTSIYELRNIDGIDGITFEKIKPLIKIITQPLPRTEWGSILAEQKKLASEEPPSKAAIDEWEDLLISPMNINNATFNDLVVIDRMTPIDASAVMRRLQMRSINSTRDLRRTKELSYYAYSSLRKYVQFADEPIMKPLSGSVRLKTDNVNRFDVGEDFDNIATRISYLESALSTFDTTALNLENVYGWTDSQCEELQERLLQELDTLTKMNPGPGIIARLKLNYQQRFRIGVRYDEKDHLYKGYAAITRLGIVNRFFLGYYRVVWGEGLMIDNSDEYRARIYNRTTGIFGDVTGNHSYDLFGAAGSFRIPIDGWTI